MTTQGGEGGMQPHLCKVLLRVPIRKVSAITPSSYPFRPPPPVANPRHQRRNIDDLPIRP